MARGRIVEGLQRQSDIGVGELHAPIKYDQPYEEPSDRQDGDRPGLEIADFQDIAVEINVGVLWIDRVDPAQSLPVIPRVEERAEERDGGQSGRATGNVRFLDDAE